jgi:DNA-binding NarL/FixJ family response regulator
MAGSYSKVALSHICDPDKGRISVDQDPNHPKRIMVVDDHPILRFGIRQLVEAEPDLRICGEADSVNRALELANDLKPDVALVDLSLAESSGLSLIRELRELLPDLRVLVLSMHEETHFAERALRAGARGYIMKQEAIAGLVQAIRVVLSGRIHVSERLAQVIFERVGNQERFLPGSLQALSDRELEVFELIGRGRSTAAIAANLAVSIKTIETYRASIKAKLNLKDATDLVRYATSWTEHF